ncbi:MAG: MFS transporter [Candidatus Eremiobacteraeota bacterium]|nr:MFS transporter [Candidatus Eremiobacteraeota bacterium]
MPVWLAPPGPAAPVPRDEVYSRYNYWRNRQLFSTYVGYIVYYFLRKNIPVAAPLMTQDLGITKAAFGVFFTLHDLVYGFAKYVAGIMADRSNPRVLLSLGLLLAAACNFGFGLGSTVTVLGVLWVLNGFFQGFGFPPSARILSHWFRPSERGLKWGIFNTSHQVGTFAILTMSAYWGSHYGWRYCFFLPALIGVLTVVFLYASVRDTPASLGLPPVEEPWDVEDAPVSFSPAPGEEPGPIGFKQPVAEEEELSGLVRRRVYRNPALWLACFANFFVYTVRYGILNWAAIYLTEVKTISLVQAGLVSGIFEIAGLVGCLMAGWATDRFFQSRRAPVCFFSMLLCALFIVAYWQSPAGHWQMSAFCIAGIGFTVYGPQFLGGLMSADLAGKRAAGTAVGFHGFFGYLSGILSGVGVSSLQAHFGWDGAYLMLAGSAVLGALVFLPIWKAGPVHE